ncbi:MAG: transcriptional regulator [Gemmatimonadales bacterium]
MAKRDGSAARARKATATEAPASKAPGPNLQAIDGDVTMPMSLDRIIHERMRLAMVSALAVHDTLSFNELKSLLETTDGNVSVHARKLEDAGYITCTKSFDGRVPRTEFRLAPAGRQALEEYLGHMEALIRRVGGA